jgi:hypothetical protein
MEAISGRVSGAKPGQQVVIYAKSGVWWVQPFSKQPFTQIDADSTFKTTTHLGTDYAALLVDSEFRAVNKVSTLPAVGGYVKAVTIAPGRPSAAAPAVVSKMIQFSGYDWEVTQVPSESGGVLHANLASNVWTDSDGFLHLRMVRDKDQWTCAEVVLTRSLGYGLYRFGIGKLPTWEPSTVLGLLTYDLLEAGQNHREIDIELSQWGDPGAKNAQFAIQPYYVAANVFRFQSPLAGMTHSFHWEPAKVSFESVRRPNAIVAQHVFTSGIPTPGGERVHLGLYPFGKSRTPQKDGVEVVIEKFEFLP